MTNIFGHVPAVARGGGLINLVSTIADYPTKFLQARDAWVERASVLGEQMTADLADRKPFLPPRSSESPATASAVSASSTVCKFGFCLKSFKYTLQ